ncbi:uncharacterized protein K452DRAFT_239956, partial [Aplosporella prunicola CBS 121167]
SWFKIAVHGVPTADILNESRESFAELVRDEVKTFNKGLNPVGNPYWLTSEEKRQTAKAGSVTLAFESEREALKAISGRLYLFGVSCAAEKLRGPRKASPPRK